MTMKELADLVDGTFDGDESHPQIYFDSEHISIFANEMTKKEYGAYEKALSGYDVKGKGFSIYAWNDVSGYAYWKNQGESHDANYIQITASIDDISKVDPKELKKALRMAYNSLSQFDNTDRHYFETLNRTKNV